MADFFSGRGVGEGWFYLIFEWGAIKSYPRSLLG